MRFPANLGWGPLAAVVAVSAGFRWGFPVLRVFVARRVLVCALCVCGGGVGVGVSSVCVGACVACGGWFPWLGLAAGVGVGVVVAGVCCGRSLATPGGGSCVRFPSTPGCVSLRAVVGVPRHSWLMARGAVHRHSWLGSASGGGVWLPASLGCGPGCGSPPLLAGVRRPRRWPFPLGSVGGSSWFVCLWRGACARGVCAGVCVVCSWWWRGCGCVFRVCWCVCVCVCACVAGAGWGLPLVWVWVWLVCVVVGPPPLLAEVPECDSPPLLAGFCCRWWWVLLATPG